MTTQASKLREFLDATGIVDAGERLRWYEAGQDSGYHNQPATNHKLLNVRLVNACVSDLPHV